MQEEGNGWEKRWVSRQGGIGSVERRGHRTQKGCRRQSWGKAPQKHQEILISPVL